MIDHKYLLNFSEAYAYILAYVYQQPPFNESIKSIYVKPNGDKASANYIWKNKGQNYFKTVRIILYSYFMNEKLVFNAQDKIISTVSVHVIENAILRTDFQQRVPF